MTKLQNFIAHNMICLMQYNNYMSNWTTLADKKNIEETINNLKQRGFDVFFVQTSNEAKEKVLNLIPDGSRVLASSSETLGKIGLSDEIDKTEEFHSVRKEYMALDHEKDADKIRILRTTPDYVIGSVHAVTKKGEVLIASNTGSQIASYVNGARKVIWIVGVQKIVENLDEGFKRIYDYVLPLESERLKKLYGVPSHVSKLLIYDREGHPNRVTLIFVNERLGF